MIPRTKVNYNLRDLLEAVFVGERSKERRQRLASRLGELLGTPHVLLMPSGRAGLYFLLKSIARPRVIVPAYTCKAVVEAARMAGKEVLFFENEGPGFNGSPARDEGLINEQSVVIATHQFGIPCDIEGICALAKARNGLVIEDAAASLGTRVAGRLAGTFGAAAFFSFDSTKLVNVPMKGGAVVTGDRDLFERVLRCYEAETGPMPLPIKIKCLAKAAILVLLEHHLLYRLFHLLYFQARARFTDDSPALKLEKDEFYRYGLAEWQAGIALKQFAALHEIVAQRRSLYAQYRERLSTCNSFGLPPEDENREWACIRFPIRVSGDKMSFYRQAVRRGLDFAFSFTFLGCPEHFTQARALASHVLDLPFYTKLSPGEVDRVVTVLRELDSQANS